jgi:hypothetical protein
MATENPPTREQLQAGQRIVIAVAETIRECGECPSGTLYAGLIGRVTLEGYQKILGILKGAGLIEITPGHLVRWTGPLGGVR